MTLEQLAGPDDRCAWPRFGQVSASLWRRVCRATLTICWDLSDVDVDSEVESFPSSPVVAVANRRKLWAGILGGELPYVVTMLLAVQLS